MELLENILDNYQDVYYISSYENVVYDNKSKVIDFKDGSKTENTRVSYPLDHIDNSVAGKGEPISSLT